MPPLDATVTVGPGQFLQLALLRARPPSHVPPRGLRDRTPAPPPPTYAVAPSVGSEATTARGEQAGRRNPRSATGAHRGPPRDSGALPGGASPGVVPVPPPPPVAEVCGPKLEVIRKLENYPTLGRDVGWALGPV